MSFHSHSSTGSIGSAPGPLTAVVGFALLLNFIGLFTFTGVALCVFGYVLLTLWMMSRAGRDAGTSRAGEAGTAVLILSWMVAIVGGAAVGAFHWVQYAHAAYAVLSVYAAAVLIWLLGRAFNALWSLLFPALGLAMLTAVTQLAAPPGSDDMEKAESWTPVAVTVVDEAGDPIRGATVYFDLVHFWQGDPEFDGDRKWWTKRDTDAEGVARTELQEDPRFKRLVIRAQHERPNVGYNEPSTIAAYVAHEDARREVALPAPKVPYLFELIMKTRPHPDSAYLAVELKTIDSAEETPSRSIDVVVASDSEFLRSVNPRTFDESDLNERGLLRRFYTSPNERFVFKLGRNLTGRPLTLYVLERDFSHNDAAFVELGTMNLGPIAAGDERTLPTISVPKRRAVANPALSGLE